MAATFDQLLAFTAFTHDIRSVKRSMFVKGEKQYDNDSEHGYQLALIAMYVIENNELPLDIYKAMALALVHDILEVHAGDTFVYGSSIKTQHTREQQAIVKLKEQWPSQKTMLSLIDEYEARDTPESKFVYALDKLVPILNNILDDGRNWKKEHITIEQIIAAKEKKISVDLGIQTYFEMALQVLRDTPGLFT
jgi:putative hydrolase of HD superfamily